MRALVRTRLFSPQIGQMPAKRRVDRRRGGRRRRPFCAVGLAQPLKQLLHDRLRVGWRGLCRQCVDTVVDRLDLVGDSFQVDLAGAHIVKPASNPIGDLINDLRVEGRSRGCLELGVQRAQHGLDWIEINRRHDRVPSRAKFMENWVQLPRAGWGVREAIQLIADVYKDRSEGLRIGVATAGGCELGVEIAQEPFDGAGVERRRGEPL